MGHDWRLKSIPDLMARPVPPFLSQNIIHSARIPRIEATHPKTIVPIPLGPHCELCWALSEVIVGGRVFKVDDGSGIWVSLSGSILSMACNVGVRYGTMFVAALRSVR